MGEKQYQPFHPFRWRRPFNHVLALFLVATAGRAQTPPPNVQHRVSPDAYDHAPVAIRAALKTRHCELPETQHWDNTQLNIVRGHFANAAQSDWAAICIAADGTTSALILWSKPAACPAEIHHGWALNGHFPAGQAGSLYLLRAPVTAGGGLISRETTDQSGDWTRMRSSKAGHRENLPICSITF